MSDEIANSLHESIGRFVITFAFVEHSLSQLLLAVLQIDGKGKYYLLRGTATRVKCLRLRGGLRTYVKCDETYLTLLSDFEEKIIPFRNKIIHGAPYYDIESSEYDPRIKITDFGANPENAWASNLHVTADELNNVSKWLHGFHQDTSTAFGQVVSGKNIEIENPWSVWWSGGLKIPK